MECDACYGRAVRLQGMACWCSGQPGAGILVLAEGGGGGVGVEFFLEDSVPLFEIEHLAS